MSLRNPKLPATERLHEGISRLELLTKLSWGFVQDHANQLTSDEFIVLLGCLDEIVEDLQVGHRALSEQHNQLHQSAAGVR